MALNSGRMNHLADGKMLDVKATAQYLGWNDWQVRNERRMNRFAPPIRMGKRLYWTVEDLDEWLRALPREGGSE